MREEFGRSLKKRPQSMDKAEMKERLYKLIWSSLDSHIGQPKDKDFHRRCQAEYAEMMFLVSKL